MTPKCVRFVNAYLTEAHGNGTKAAILAGFSAKTAGQAASRLLKRPDIQAAVGRKLQKANITTARALENVSAIASLEPAKVTASDVLKANELILRVNGALNDKRGEAKVTVNIGFLSAATGPTAPPTAITASIETDDSESHNLPVVVPEVMSQRAHLIDSGD